MSVFTIPDLGGGAPGPTGPPGSATTGGYAQIFSAGSAIAQALTAAAGFQKVTAFDTDGFSAGNATPVSASGRITTFAPGVWYIFFSLSWGTPAVGNATVRIFKNGLTAIPEVSAGTVFRPLATGDACSAGNSVRLDIGEFLEVFIDVSADATLTFDQSSLVAFRESP